MPLTVERLRKVRQIEYEIDKFLKAIKYKDKVLAMNAKLAETSYRYFLPFVDAYMKFTIKEINDAFSKKYINKSLSFEKDEFTGIPKIDPGKLDMAVPYSDKIVNQYMEDIKAGKNIIPIFIDEKNPKHIVDGLHRASAYQRLGMEVPYIRVDRIDALTSLAKPKMTPEKYFNQIVVAADNKAITITDNLLDWGGLDNSGVKMLKPATLEIMANSGNLASKIAGIEGSFDIINLKTVEIVNQICSQMVTMVGEETKKAINEVIRQGLLDGKSMGKVAKELKPLIGLNGK